MTELKGLITHVAFYAGWPCAVNAVLSLPRTAVGPVEAVVIGSFEGAEESTRAGLRRSFAGAVNRR